MDFDKNIERDMIYRLLKNDGLGAGRRSRKPRPVRRFERCGEPMVSETSCLTRFLEINMVSVQAFYVFLLAKTLCV